MKSTIVFRLFKDASLTEMHPCSVASDAIKKFLKPWMKVKHEPYQGVDVCKIDVYEEEDPGAALCTCFEEGFILSSLEELSCLNIARSALGYYDFFEENSEIDVKHSERLRKLARYMLSGDSLHQAHLRLFKENGEEVDFEKLKTQKCDFVHWLTEARNLSKEEAIALVNQEIPEIKEASSEFPDYTQNNFTGVEMDPKTAYELIVRLCGPKTARRLGWKGLTDKDYDNLFNV